MQMIFSEISGIKLGDGFPVRIMGVINASRESFYKGSVGSEPEAIATLARNMVEQGADIIDVGGMSTAPYTPGTEVSSEQETSRLLMAISTIRSVDSTIPISVDTPRSKSAEASLDAGATIVNDVSGLKYDPKMKDVISAKNACAILMAHESKETPGSPLERVKSTLRHSLEIAKSAGIAEQKLVLDPGVGFFRKAGAGFGFSPSGEIPWHVWDSIVINKLAALRELGRPTCVSISRKSFIGKILGIGKPEDRLVGSLAGNAIAVFNGANLIRTHDVLATRQAAKIAEAIRESSAR
jgi:dihydropteroate synthase